MEDDLAVADALLPLAAALLAPLATVDDTILVAQGDAWSGTLDAYAAVHGAGLHDANRAALGVPARTVRDDVTGATGSA